jgi:hypothetical protein
MHGMSTDTTRTPDTPTAEEPVSIFTAATLAKVAFASAERRASKLRGRGKWGAKYEADLNRCREAMADITAAILATTERLREEIRSDQTNHFSHVAPGEEPGEPTQQQDDGHCGWAYSIVDRRSREAIAAELLGSLASVEELRDGMGERYVAHLKILAGLPSANVRDIAVKLAHVMHNQTIHRPPSGFDGETAEYCLIAGALADLVLLRAGPVRPTEDVAGE